MTTKPNATKTRGRRPRGFAVRALAGVGAIALAALLASPADANGGAGASARFRVSYGNLPVGHADTTLKLGADGSYGVGTTFSSGGLAKLLKRTEGRAASSGSLGGALASPARFSLAYRSGKKERSREIAFGGGGVASVAVRPDKPVPNPATAAQLAGAIDPASALLVRAPDGAAVCNRTIPLFDGKARLDLVLSPRRTKSFRTKGWRGEVRVCAVSLEPLAGVKPKSKREMDRIKGATVAFAPVPGTDAWMAVELTVPSSIGTVSAKATRLSFGS